MTDTFCSDIKRALLHVSHVLELHGMGDKWCEVYLKIKPNKNGYNSEFIRVYKYMEEEDAIKCMMNRQLISGGVDE